MATTIQKQKSLKQSLGFVPGREQKIPRRRIALSVPASNIDESATEYILTIAVPGFNREALHIDIDKDIISVYAAKEVPAADHMHNHCEYDYRQWKRVFTLPVDAASLMTSAIYRNGELIVRIPKGNTERSRFTHPVYVY
jgi:HSP20 family protein